ncbi:TPA: helix-turn-helix domain-containing protein [Streptococcus agalactiae]
MLKHFGSKVRNLRVTRNITREDFCGDETELSVRQLARIESGQSIPNLTKAHYIAKQLNVKLDILTGGESLELPKRYKELKYKLLRTPTYGDANRLAVREAYFDEIYEVFYEELPEDERLIIDCMQSKLDVHFSVNDNFGITILHDYFDQIKKKKEYTTNDFVMIDLYLLCFSINYGMKSLYSLENYHFIMSKLLEQDNLLPEDNFQLNNVLLNHVELAFQFKQKKYVQQIIHRSNAIMTEIHDFQKRPILSLIEWKYLLIIEKDRTKAETCFKQSILFAELIGDLYLKGKLIEEWNKYLT